jgi:flagellar motor switch protein FliN/FliY
VEILVNNKLIAKGEVVVEAGKYGIRVTEVLSREDRLKTLR